MKALSDLEYLQLNKLGKLWYNLKKFFCAIPSWFVKLGKGIWNVIKKCGIAIKNEFVDIFNTFKNGSWQTKVSYLIMGFGSIARGQVGRGILFFLMEAVFVFYMFFAGGYWLQKAGMFSKSGVGWLSKWSDLGSEQPHREYDELSDVWYRVDGDDSFKIMLYGLLTIFFIIALIYTWRLNVKQNGILDKIVAERKHVKTAKDDLRYLVDEGFHKTLLTLPVIGIAVFTVMPIIFMILIAFTNYDASHDGYSNLFTWIGWDNFNELFSGTAIGGGNLTLAFGEILSWTLIWAFFATFTNYFLGMFVAIMINKKGIKLKKMWRTILVMTIAIPQFISLMYVSKLFSTSGLINGLLMDWGWIDAPIRFWESKVMPDGSLNGNLARVMVILINIWIGIPYLMLMVTGILMNIPADLYESAKIDGANVWQQYTKITLPYILFVTGPYLLTSFIGNINNFNVIYLLTGGGPDNPALLTSGGSAGFTDLLITWLFKITTGATSNYKLAAVIAIMIFLVVAVLSLIVYNVMPSTRNEEDYS